VPVVSPNNIQQNNYMLGQLNNPYQSGLGLQQQSSFQSNNMGANLNLGGFGT
jgi:hypothetical protein